MNLQDPYFKATRHPWPCFLFLLPLLLAYEVGVLWLGGTQPDTLRNGADAWLRWALEAFGLYHLYWAPALLANVILVWSYWRWEQKPKDVFGVVSGMTIESVVFALGLWGVSRLLGPLLNHFGVQLDLQGPLLKPFAPEVESAFGLMITFVGAGIYEETLFRLVLFSGLSWLLRAVTVPNLMALGSAALASSLLFAAAHHFGPFGEQFDGYIFLFRTVAGVYFAVLFQVRGFGVAVGAHACYDVLAGVAVG